MVREGVQELDIESAVKARYSGANVTFGKGRIQDLALDLDRLDAETARLRTGHPLVADGRTVQGIEFRSVTVAAC